MSKSTYAGGCHCGAVRFEADLDLDRGVSRCNCTLCVKRGIAGSIGKPGDLRLLAGEGELATYQHGAKVTRFFFCRRCGVHVFGRGNIPQLGGDYVSVNVNCID